MNKYKYFFISDLKKEQVGQVKAKLNNYLNYLQMQLKK